MGSMVAPHYIENCVVKKHIVKRTDCISWKWIKRMHVHTHYTCMLYKANIMLMLSNICNRESIPFTIKEVKNNSCVYQQE